MNALGASNGSTSAVAIEGKPRVYERATIKPNTAADIVFNGLSSATLYSKASIPTATPTAIRAAIATVSPRFQPDVVVTGHHKTTATTASIKSATKVNVINLSLVIQEYSFGLDISMHTLLDGNMPQSRNNEFIRLSQSKLAKIVDREDLQKADFTTIYRRKKALYASL